MDANALIDSIALTINSNSYKLDTINFLANSENGIDSIALSSEFANMIAVGKYDYTKVGSAIIQYINKFYPINKNIKDQVGEQQLVISGSIEQHPLIKDIVPGLTDYERIKLDGNFDTGIAPRTDTSFHGIFGAEKK